VISPETGAGAAGLVRPRVSAVNDARAPWANRPGKTQRREGKFDSLLHNPAVRSRPTLTAGQLYTKLQEAFEGRWSADCSKCKVPIPHPVPRPDPESANWRIGTMASCEHKCDLILATLAIELASRYDVSEYSLI
jgi:hypothetical protein